MTRTLARLSLALYPLAYRRRYGAELEALVEDQPSSPSIVLDLLRGAAAAHLRPSSAVAGEVDPAERARLGMSAVVLCTLLFAGSGLVVYKTVEGHALARAADAHPLVGLAYTALQAAAVLAGVLMLVGGLPFVLAAVRRGAVVRGSAAIALGCVGVGCAASAALVASANAGPSPGVAAVVIGVWAIIALACGSGIALAARRWILGLDPGMPALRRSTLAAVVQAVAMASGAFATGTLLLALVLEDPGLAASGNGPLGLVSVAGSLVIAFAAMAALAGTALLSAGRAWVSLRVP